MKEVMSETIQVRISRKMKEAIAAVAEAECHGNESEVIRALLWRALEASKENSDDNPDNSV